MNFLIDNYSTHDNSQPMYLHTAFFNMEYEGVLSDIAANSVFDLFDTIKPNVVITSAQRLNKETIFYMKENPDLGIHLLLNIDNLNKENVEQLCDFMLMQDVTPLFLFTSNYSLPDKIKKINVVKLLPAADNNQISEAGFDYNIERAIIINEDPEDMQYDSSFHVISTDPNMKDKADIVLPAIGLRSIYPKYNEIIIRNLKFTTQVFFDAILSGSKVYYQNSKDTGVQSLINKIFKKDFNLDYNSDDRVKDFSEIRDIVKEKHTGDNRAKTILSQIKGVK